jgi:hypothetical protein
MFLPIGIVVRAGCDDIARTPGISGETMPPGELLSLLNNQGERRL